MVEGVIFDGVSVVLVFLSTVSVGVVCGGMVLAVVSAGRVSISVVVVQTVSAGILLGEDVVERYEVGVGLLGIAARPRSMISSSDKIMPSP